jgi:hypothetical protein
MSAGFGCVVTVALTGLSCGAAVATTGAGCEVCGWAASAHDVREFSRAAAMPKSTHEIAEMVRIDERRKQSSERNA